MDGIPRMRTINEAYALIRQADPDTRISRHAFRMMVVQGKIPSYKLGNRFLLDIDKMLETFAKELSVEDLNEHPED